MRDGEGIVRLGMMSIRNCLSEGLLEKMAVDIIIRIHLHAYIHVCNLDWIVLFN